MDEREDERVAESMENFRRMHANFKPRIPIRMVPEFYTPEEAERLIKWIRDYPLPFFKEEKSTTGLMIYTKEEAIVLVKSRIRQ